MTEIEAIEFIEHIPINGFQKYVEALNIAIKALDKQISKKPIKIETKIPELRERSFIEMRCPVCRTIVGNGEFFDEYCTNCGQRIDFSE